MEYLTIQELVETAEKKPMSDAVYLKILQESEPDFSEKICEGLSLEDLDEEAIRVMKKKYALGTDYMYIYTWNPKE